MIAHEAPAPVLYKEPGLPARLFVYGFAFASPLLILAGGLVPAAFAIRFDGTARIAVAVVAGLAYAAVFANIFRAVRHLASRFTPPLALPGDIWNIGVASPPRRSRNWPIVFRRPA